MKPSLPLSLVGLAVAVLATGCASSGGGSVPAVANPYSSTGGSTLSEVHVNTMRAFGDSYTDPRWTNSIGTINWATQLQGRGTVTTSKIYALGGARAAYGEQRALNNQITTALSKGSIADGDLTVIYIGHNDIGHTGSPDNLQRAAAGLRDGVSRLVAAGAANDKRRLFITQIHNWSRGPNVSDGTASQARAWNNDIASIANSNPNIIAVDMYTVFERIFADPAKFGFTNVTTASPSRSSVDALYYDGTHFGSRGQDIITRVYQHYLTRGWDWANSVSAGSESAARINSDIDNGTLVLGLAEQKALKSGLRLLPLGMKEGDAFQFRQTNRNVFQPFAAGKQGDTPSGLALDMPLGNPGSASPARMGLAVFQQDQAQYIGSSSERSSKQYTSDAMSLYWNKPMAGWMLSSQLSHLNLDFTGNAKDDLVQRTLVNRHAGNTWSFENKMRYPMRGEFFNFTPWVSLTNQSHSLDPALSSTLYTTDVSYSSNRVNEWLSGLGVDLQTDPMALGGQRKLRFGGSLHHVTSLSRDSVTVSMRETGNASAVQTEVFQLPKVNRTHLGLQAVLDMAPNLQFSATYGAQLQQVRSTQSVVFKANLSF